METNHQAQKFAGTPTADGLLTHLRNAAILNETKPTERVRRNKAKLRHTRT